VRNSGGFPTTTAPKNDRDRTERLWKGRIPTEHLDDHIVIRDIGLSAMGKLDQITRDLAARLDVSDQCGA
jgi:hypothetical protein